MPPTVREVMMLLSEYREVTTCYGFTSAQRQLSAKVSARESSNLTHSLSTLFRKTATLSHGGFNLVPVCSNLGPNLYDFLCSMKTKLLFHFRGCLANLISGMHTIQNLDEKNSVPGRLSEFYSSVPSVLVLNLILF